jgi:DNA-binding transcriptional ArsR family regulator
MSDQEKKDQEKKEKKKQARFLFNEKNKKEIQLLEAVQNRAILEPLETHGLSLGELQSKLVQMKEEPIEKSTLAYRISRLKTAGLVRKQTRQIDEEEARSPEYRGWRTKKVEDRIYQAELGFELTKNGKDALKVMRDFTQQPEPSPQKEEVKEVKKEIKEAKKEIKEAKKEIKEAKKEIKDLKKEDYER